METQPSDPGATPSRPRPRQTWLRTTVIAALAFAAGGLIVAVLPFVLTWKEPPPAVRATITLEPKKYWLEPAPDPEEVRREFAQYKRRQESFIKTNAVLAPALGEMEVQSVGCLKEQQDKLGWLREHLQIEFPESTSYMIVSIRDASPEDQAALVNAVAASYLRCMQDVSRASLEGELKRAEKVYGRCRDELAAKRKALADAEDALGSAALGDEIAVKEVLVRRLLSSIEELRLQEEFPRQVGLIDKAHAPESK